MSERISTASDKAGIASAVLCTIHCLVIPALFLLKFSLTDSTAFRLPSWWEQMDYIFLVVSFLAVFHSAKHTNTKEIKVSLWIFWAMLAIAIIFQSAIHLIAYIASAGLIATHYLNIRRLRRNMRLSNK